jgi:replicative DNA helicase
VSKLRQTAYSMKDHGGVDLIIIDYLQLMTPDDFKRGIPRQEIVAEISRSIKKLALELKIPIIVLSQLNRSSVSEKKEPTMDGARESGAIEQDADLFIILHAPDAADLPDQERQTWNALKKKGYKYMRVIVDKNRQGRCGRFPMAFDGDHMKYVSIGDVLG